ncbi:cobalamin biosynthesis protein [Microcoleus sp. LEGE 07076]|uniref:adenosylcobinamide-phosphate synthase CbiB n=1 Tax=Microcoleus sp. LEGE 07076 TaxID=915322 RepID=UPI00188046F1|nr:adenosylcobinamide-phosphate synthase CbiB [Microcoleus sp. LEGE 07076]MBE9184093.1 cobalamin biosynthesis protein [Microcoleus sp. LEGE 07076]
MMSAQFTVLILAAVLDYSIGDPWGWPHPVQAMGWAIDRYTRLVFNISNHPAGKMSPAGDRPAVVGRKLLLRCAGTILAIGLILGSYTVSWSIVLAASWVHPLLSIALQTILLASCFAGRSLRAAAEDVLAPLTVGDLVKARERLSLYVGRDTENLSEPEILRALLETVTENAVDGVIAPLFYALVGFALPHLLLSFTNVPIAPDSIAASAIVSLAIAYKAASTLDSTVGYKEEPYTDLGWFSAKLEDVLTWIPCRLTVITLALISGKPMYIWQICQRDAVKDASPNSGWSECAYAAILGVQLGGTNSYRGVIKHKPLLGEPIHPIAPEQICQALQLTRYCFVIWLGLSLVFYSSWCFVR